MKKNEKTVAEVISNDTFAISKPGRDRRAEFKTSVGDLTADFPKGVKESRRTYTSPKSGFSMFTFTEKGGSKIFAHGVESMCFVQEQHKDMNILCDLEGKPLKYDEKGKIIEGQQCRICDSLSFGKVNGEIVL